MRSSLFILLLLLLNPPLAYGNKQYSEGACMLLDQQMQRFSHQPQNSNYRNAKSEYGRYCHNPVPTLPRESHTFGDTTLVTPVASRQASSGITKATELKNSEPNGKAPFNKALAEPILVSGAQATESVPPAALPVATEMPAIAAIVQPVLIAVNSEVITVATVATIYNSAASGTATNDWLIRILNNLPLLAAIIFALLLAVFLLTSWFGFNLPGFKGVFAEYKLNRLLRWRLARSYQHFRKLKLLTAKDELVVIDHLVLSPFGIFVIMVKGYRGRIFGSETAANWTRQYFGKSKQFMNPLHQNFKNVEAVKHLLQLQGTEVAQHVHSVIAFSRVGQFNTDMPAYVTYVDIASAYLKQFDDPCLSDEQLKRFSALLGQASIDN